MTATLSDRMDSAVADMDLALVKMFTAMPERMKQKYELDGGQIQLAIALAMVSCAATILTARADAPLEDGLQLRYDLRALAANWLLEHTTNEESPADCVDSI